MTARWVVGAILLGVLTLAAMWVTSTTVFGSPHLWAFGNWRAVSVGDFANYPVMTTLAVLGGLVVGKWRTDG